MIERTEQEIMKNWKANIDIPVVSVCCATYNQENYIAEAIDNFLIQETDFPFEILIRDDCSTDKTASIVKKYTDKYQHLIKPIFEKENTYSKGVKPTLVLFKRAQGKYIALCEGDDYWTDPMKLQKQVGLMQENPECHLSFHPADELVNSKLTGKVYGNQGIDNKIFSDIEMIRSIGAVFCPTASMIFHRTVMDPTPIFYSTAPVGDDFMQYLGSLNGGALFIAETMSIYRTGHAGSWNEISKQKNKASIASLIKNKENFILRYTQSLDEMGNFIDQKYRNELNKKISVKLLYLALLYLNNNMDKDFKNTIIRAINVHKSQSRFNMLLYYFRFTPFFARIMINLNNNTHIKKAYLSLRKKN